MKQDLKARFEENLKQLGWDSVSVPSIALAVSGGIDSMALLHITIEWLQDNFSDHKSKLIVLIVDHGLRSNSGQQANELKSYLDKLNVANELLVWKEDKLKQNYSPQSNNLEARARNARYNLLTDYCQSREFNYIFTAHHMDDEIENFFIKLMRGSGLLGLSPSRKMIYNDTVIFRPVYNFLKQELKDYISERNIPYWHDNTNDETSFLRNNIRANLDQFLSNFGEAEFLKTRISSSLSNLLEGVEVIKTDFSHAKDNCVYIAQAGYAKINIYKLWSYPREIIFQLLSYMLTIIGGNLQTPRAERLERLLLKLENKEEIKNYTLHGTISNFDNSQYLLITREPDKISKNSLKITAEDIIWDNRYLIYLTNSNEEISEQLYIGAVGIGNGKKFRHYIRGDKNLRKALPALPCIKTSQKIVAIPHIFYYDASLGEILKRCLHIEFSPGYNSRLTQ